MQFASSVFCVCYTAPIHLTPSLISPTIIINQNQNEKEEADSQSRLDYYSNTLY